MQPDELFFDPFYVSLNGITYSTSNLANMADRLIKAGKRDEAEQLRAYNRYIKRELIIRAKNEKGKKKK